MNKLHIGSDFSRTPGGRFYTDGPDSGQMFRERFLVPAIKAAMVENSVVEVILDGPRGYLSSFLEEAFGGLIRYGLFSHEQLKSHLRLTASDRFYETYKLLAEKYISEARIVAKAS